MSDLAVWSAFTKACGKVLIIPYDWNSTLKCPYLSPHRRSRALNAFCIQFAIIIAYEIFLAYRGVQILNDDARGITFKMKLVLTIIVYVLLNVDQWLILRNFDLYPLLLASFVKLFNKVQARRTIEERRQEQRQLKKRLLAILIGCAAAAFGRATQVLRQPQFPALLTSLLPAPTTTPLAVKLFFFCVHQHINAFHYMALAFNLMNLTLYNYGFVKMAQALKPHESRRLTNASYQHLARSYRQLSIMQIVFNELFSSFVFIAQLMSIVFVIINLFLAVADHNVRGLIVGLLILLIICIVYNILAQVYEDTKNVRRSWTTAKRPKWFLRFVRSTRPQNVRVGSYFFIDKGILLTVLNMILANTANLILTHGL